MPKISKTQLIKLQKQLKTDTAIAKKLGITSQYVYLIRKGYGIPSSKAANMKRDKRIVELYTKGASGLAIAEQIGLTYSHVYKIINKGGAGKKKTAKKVLKKKTPSKK